MNRGGLPHPNCSDPGPGDLPSVQSSFISKALKTSTVNRRMGRAPRAIMVLHVLPIPFFSPIAVAFLASCLLVPFIHIDVPFVVVRGVLGAPQFLAHPLRSR